MAMLKENWCKGNYYARQPEKETDVLCGPQRPNEKHTGRYDTLMRTIEEKQEGKEGR